MDAPRKFMDCEAVKKAIEKALPKSDDEIGVIGNEPVFRLCQYLMGVVPQGTISDELYEVVLDWYEKAEVMLDDDLSGVWLEFCELWDGKKIKYPKRNALNTAVSRAQLRQFSRPEATIFADKNIIELIHVCYELQQLAGDEPFFLSQADAGKIIGKSQSKGRAALNRLVRKGIIELVRKGHTGLSTEYRYIGDKKINVQLRVHDQLKRLMETEKLRGTNKR